MNEAERNQLIQTTWLLWASQLDDAPPMLLVEKLVEMSDNPYAYGGIWAVPHSTPGKMTLAYFEGRPAPHRMHNVVLMDDKVFPLNGYTERAMRFFATELGDPGSEVKRWGQREAQLT